MEILGGEPDCKLFVLQMLDSHLEVGDWLWIFVGRSEGQLGLDSHWVLHPQALAELEHELTVLLLTGAFLA